MYEIQAPESIPITLVRVKCKYCGHIWYSRSYKGYVTCPNCNRRNRNPRYLKR